MALPLAGPDNSVLMSSSRRRANRRNAQLSTGPRTAPGKAVASKNALKHGLLSSQVVLPDEDQREFDALRTGLFDDLVPQGELESVFAERIVLATWRLRRVVRLEASVIRSQQGELQSFPDVATQLIEAQRRARSGPAPGNPRVADEPSSPERNVYLAMVRDAHGTNQLERLRRYETTIERSLLSSIHELERLQGRRRGDTVDSPQVVDVNISGRET
jgi:hypothetical protein